MSIFPGRVRYVFSTGLVLFLFLILMIPQGASSKQPPWTPHVVDMKYKVQRYDFDADSEGARFRAPWRFTFTCKDPGCHAIRSRFRLRVDTFRYGLVFKPRSRVSGETPLSRVVWKSSKYVSKFAYGCEDSSEYIYGMRFSVKLRMVQLPSHGNVVRWKIVGTHKEIYGKFRKGLVSKACQKELINSGLKLGHRPVEVYSTSGIGRAHT